jgi:hypothetical protein
MAWLGLCKHAEDLRVPRLLLLRPGQREQQAGHDAPHRAEPVAWHCKRSALRCRLRDNYRLSPGKPAELRGILCELAVKCRAVILKPAAVPAPATARGGRHLLARQRAPNEL